MWSVISFFESSKGLLTVKLNERVLRRIELLFLAAAARRYSHGPHSSIRRKEPENRAIKPAISNI